MLRLRLRPVLAIAAALALPAAAAPKSPHDVLAQAVEAQGKLKQDDLKDIVLSFKGQAVQDGNVQRVERTYWYKIDDGSFQIQTASRRDAEIKSVRGIIGERACWERRKDRRVLLSRRDREDREVVKTIRKERDEFRRVLRMVILSRLQHDEDATLNLVSNQPALLPKDLPHEANAILGRDRNAVKYWVLDVDRPNEPRIRLYVRTDDSTVRKAVEFSQKKPGEVENVYYFGPYSKRGNARGMLLPLYFSMHYRIPIDKKSKEKTTLAYGRVKVQLNTGWDPRAFGGGAKKKKAAPKKANGK